MMAYKVYVLRSQRTEKFYIGHSERFDERLREHNSGESKSTKSGIPWELVYQKEFQTRSEAMRQELQIKKRGIERFLRGVAQPG